MPGKKLRGDGSPLRSNRSVGAARLALHLKRKAFAQARVPDEELNSNTTETMFTKLEAVYNEKYRPAMSSSLYHNKSQNLPGARAFTSDPFTQVSPFVLESPQP